MKIKDLFINGELLTRLDRLQNFNADWLHSTDKPIVDIQELDNYIYMCIKDSTIEKCIESDVYFNIRAMINANNYRLSKLWDSVNFEYNPIDNYDRTETQTHNEQIQTGEHKTKTDIGARSQTNNNGTYTDTTTNTASNSAFDSTAYDRATTKDINSFNKGASVDSINTASASDTVTQEGYTDNSNGGYTLRARGNIGTMSTQNMINQEREIVDYTYFDEIVKLFERYITTMCYD